jgi:hypothetical protein
MGRDFNGTNSYLNRADRLGITGYPISMFTWFKGDTFATNNRSLMGFFEDQGGYNDLFKFAVVTSGAIEMVSYDATNGYVGPTTSATASTGVWNSALAVFAASNDKRLYLNGANKVTNTGASAVTFTDLNRFVIGAFGMGTPYEYFDGQIMHSAIWTAALDDQEALSLHNGIHPIRVRPASLLAYWSIDGRTSPEIDIIRGNGLTVTNFSSVIEDGPRIFQQTIGA